MVCLFMDLASSDAGKRHALLSTKGYIICEKEHNNFFFTSKEIAIIEWKVIGRVSCDGVFVRGVGFCLVLFA